MPAPSSVLFSDLITIPAKVLAFVTLINTIGEYFFVMINGLFTWPNVKIDCFFKG